MESACSRSSRHLAQVPLVCLAIAALVACGSGTDKAGGRGNDDAVTLTLAKPTGALPPELDQWISAVTDASNGTVDIDVRPPANSDLAWRAGEVDFEAGTIKDVSTGTIDMAWVGARAFDRLGIAAFQPLLAPLLVDSHDLQDAVFHAGIPQRMLPAVDTAEIVGLAVLPGPMRKVLGIDHPFLQPGDFAGAVVGINDSAQSDESLRALGATPRAVPASAPLDGLDGYEQQPKAIVDNHYATVATYITANLDLWPRPLVVIINRRRFESLSRSVRSILRDAGDTALDSAAAAARAEDTNAVASLCREGFRLPVATDAQLDAIRSAVEPVYDRLRAGSSTSVDLAAIEQINSTVGAPPDASTCPDLAATPTTAVTDRGERIAGTYSWTITTDDLERAGQPADLPSTLTITLDDGRWTLRESDGPEVDYGTYELVGDRVTFTWDTGAVLTFTTDIADDGVVTLTPVQPMPAGDAFVWSTEPWHPVNPSTEPTAPPTTG